ncbi:MAG: carboxypeptidase-like regulatory domain-containing protein, partial [Ignavibacteriaceae bacterium]|nr:carboxypeptidase-like regulatory domain-containing protein [Ignavibacteriaceae bacterium]
MIINKIIFVNKKFVICPLVVFYLFAISINLFSQNNIGIVKGYVKDENKNPLELVTVAVLNTSIGTTCDKNGYFEISVSSNENIALVISRVGYLQKNINVKIKNGEIKIINLTLEKKETELPSVEIVGKQITKEGMQKLDIKS